MKNLQIDAAQHGQTYLMVLNLLDEVGLNHRVCFTPGIFAPDYGSIQIAGGVDILKAGRVPCFAEKITDHQGMTNPAIAQTGLLPGRRALLAHVIDILKQQHGADVTSQHHAHSQDCEESHVITLNGTRIGIELHAV